MNLYKIYQVVNNEYDTFDSAIVAAESEEQAKKIVPCHVSYLENCENQEFKEQQKNWYIGNEWCNPEYVQVMYLGIAKDGTQPGVILASYNAG